MAISDSLVAAFYNKYHYNFWRPETAIRAGATDGNTKTDADPAFMPFIVTPCFPSYPSNHGSGSNGGANGRAVGGSGEAVVVPNTAPPDPPEPPVHSFKGRPYPARGMGGARTQTFP